MAAPTSAAGTLGLSAGFWTPKSLFTYKLTAAKGGNGSGIVTSTSHSGLIACGVTCEAGFVYGTSVTLSAAPSAGSSFTGWSGGGCSGTGSCTVSMTAATTVTAAFTLNTYRLTVTMAGWGAGSVITTSPSGAIDCGRICDASFTTVQSSC